MLLGAGLAIGSPQLRPLWSLGLFIAPALVAGVYDLRERAMLGDTGANLLGALAGLWLVLALSADRPAGGARAARADHALRRAALDLGARGADPGAAPTRLLGQALLVANLL